MKKIFALLSFLILFNQIAQSQPSKWSVGLSLGPSFSNFMTESSIKSQLISNNQFNFKTNLQIQLSNHLFINSGLGYIIKGARIPNMVFYDSLGNTTGKVTFYMNYGYIRLPLSIGYITNNSIFNLPIKLSFSVGGYFGYLLNRKDKIKGLNVRDTILHKGIVYDDDKDFGITFSGLAEYPISNRLHFRVSVIYDYGLNNFIAHPELNNISPYYFNSKHQSISFNIGLKYYFQKKKILFSKEKKPPTT